MGNKRESEICIKFNSDFSLPHFISPFQKKKKNKKHYVHCILYKNNSIDFTIILIDNSCNCRVILQLVSVIFTSLKTYQISIYNFSI